MVALSRGSLRVTAAAGALAAALLLSSCSVQQFFPKAFPSEAPPPEPPPVRASPAAESEWKTVITQAGDMSFRIRSDWTMEVVPSEPGFSATGIPAHEVRNAAGRLIATLQQNPGDGLPEALPGATIQRIDSVPARKVPLLVDSDNAKVVFDLTTHPNAKSHPIYGLTAGGKGLHGNKGYPLLAGPLLFQGELALDRSIRSAAHPEEALEAAKEYVYTQEYADLVAMFLSLEYHPKEAKGTSCEGASFTFTTVNIDCDTVLQVYQLARWNRAWESRKGATVRVAGDYKCTLDILGAADLGPGVDGTCRYSGGYGSFSVSWKK
ncbi:hypothetical protein NCCP1664_18610 [Zafaria cholistanensis]|uniref:Lipoprotein n=1 Tax=Zafaria cholistanensis TaxID=1682741 RepID=A0A5A7NRI6_9MICC|nr:hypothetical protein [Zafaria cholistanensis]GER23365.1 hypothetical protein NCCP1664_18610 [Zafaria cholistanensis]